MKKNVITNGKIRKSVDEIIHEIPQGMRRYSVSVVDKHLRMFSNTDIDYCQLVNIIEHERNNIVLWDVKTARTARTFSIHFQTK